MKKRYPISLFALALILVMLPACGGGTSSSPQAPAPTTAVIKIATTGQLDPATKIGGITVSGLLPSGVTVKAAPDTQNPLVLVTNSGVVIASGVTGRNASTLATYNAATRKIDIQVYDQDGFGTGEFVTVKCDIAPAAATPAAGSFGLGGFIAKDLNGAEINGLTAGLSVDMR